MRRLLSIFGLFLLCNCGGHKEAQPATTPPPLLIDERGTTMPFEKAIVHVSFRPYVPSAQILAYAVLPPLGGLDTDANRGLGIEYLAGNDAMLLSQWPKREFQVAFKRGELSAQPCEPAHYSPQAIAMVTQRNVVITLQPDGPVPPGRVDAEMRRLVRAGACR